MHEAGGHRFQRVPPTERRGRVQTSTITVAVLPMVTEAQIKIDTRDLEFRFTRGSGAGGQNRNKTDSCVLLLHRPSGLRIRCDGGRSQTINKATALDILRANLQDTSNTRQHSENNNSRRQQLGGGARGDKRRTIALQRDTVTDHVLQRTISAKRYLRGHLRDLLR